MKSLLDRLFDLLKESSKSESIEERWIAQSKTLEEVERRQRMIMRGEAPWQKMGGLY